VPYLANVIRGWIGAAAAYTNDFAGSKVDCVVFVLQLSEDFLFTVSKLNKP
jgi:hypothetical protein